MSVGKAFGQKQLATFLFESLANSLSELPAGSISLDLSRFTGALAACGSI